MVDKKTDFLKSPDLSKLKEVVIDHRTRIYIAPDADIEEAKSRYVSLMATRKSK